MVSVSIVMVSFYMKDVRAILLTANREQYEVLFPQVEGSRYFRQLFQMVKAIPHNDSELTLTTILA